MKLAEFYLMVLFAAPELNLKTYEKWLDIAPILELQNDLICTLAVKGAVAQTWSGQKAENNSEWSLYPKHSALLKEIKKCIQLMTGPKALEYGTAALYYVANHTPPGEHKIDEDFKKKCVILF